MCLQVPPPHHMSPPRSDQHLVSSPPPGGPVSGGAGSPSGPSAPVQQQQAQQQQQQQPGPDNLRPGNTCIRRGCPNAAIANSEWEDEYCSNECVVSHCRLDPATNIDAWFFRLIHYLAMTSFSWTIKLT